MSDNRPSPIQVRVGYEVVYDCPQQTPMVLMLNIHHSRANDIVIADRMITEPSVTSRPTGMVLATGVLASLPRRAA